MGGIGLHHTVFVPPFSEQSELPLLLPFPYKYVNGLGSYCSDTFVCYTSANVNYRFPGEYPDALECEIMMEQDEAGYHGVAVQANKQDSQAILMNSARM